MDELVATKCPPSSPYKCPRYGQCYNMYQYCSPKSNLVEECIDKNILNNDTSRLKFCQDLFSNTVNISEKIRDESCNMKAACFSEFETKVYSSIYQPQAENDDSSTWSPVVTVLFILLLASIASNILLALYCMWKKSKGKPVYCMWKKTKGNNEEELAEVLINTNDLPPSTIAPSRRIGDTVTEITGQTTATESEGNDTQALRQRQTDEGETNNSSQNSSSTISLSGHNTPPIDSAANTNTSNQSVGVSIASSENQQREASNSTISMNNDHSDMNNDEHPAETESRNLRGIHLPSTEPCDNNEVVTSKSQYNQTQQHAIRD